MVSKKMKLSGIMLVGIIIIVSFGCAVQIQPVVTGNTNDNPFTWPSSSRDPNSYTYELVDFSSYEDFTSFLHNCSSHGAYNKGYGRSFANAPMMAVDMDDGFAEGAALHVGSGGEKVDFSETNIQVAGVDEPDMVKTDGKYLYVVANQKVYIVKAYPAGDAKVLSTITKDYSISNIFINGDKLVVFGNSYSYFICNEKEDIDLPNPWFDSSNTYINIYDLSDRDEPVLEKDIVVAGNYFNARMIGDYVYIITNQYSYSLYDIYGDDEFIVPLIAIDGVVEEIPLSHICCIDIPSNSYTLTHIVSINVKDTDEEVIDKIFTLGNSQTMYVSKNNIYITYQTNYNDYTVMQQIIDEVVFPILPDDIKEDILNARGFDIQNYNKQQVVQWILNSFYETLDEQQRNDIQMEIQKRIHRTVIHKIAVDDGNIKYVCNGSIPGRVLNQFSLDEHNGFLRVAVQTDGYWQSNIKKCTNVYILDEKLAIVGEVENIAPGENMKSARFMGERAYLVTFKNVDPFFVLDLSDPYDPEILGELKIPGYSDYLHPYDETHVIGIGKDADETIDADRIHSEDAVYYTAILGVKIALFDVSDPENPKEVAKVIIGDRGTSTPVLNNHKALLFDREKELLVLPISLYEFKDNGRNYADFTFQGAYVYKLSLEDGFDFQGRITHRDVEEPSTTKGYRYYHGSSYDVTRSLYIGNVLYTISNGMIKMNNLGDLNEINSVKLS